MQYIQSNQVVLLQNANLDISTADSGKILVTPQTAGGVTVVYTLPALSQGLHYRFVNGAAAALSGSAQINTNAATATLFGSILSGPTNGVALLDAPGSTQIRFLTAVSVLGDYIDLYCDGTRWFVNGRSRVAGGITVT